MKFASTVVAATPKHSLEEEWENIKHHIEKTAQESLGKKNKWRSRKAKNVDIEHAVKEKQKAYNEWLSENLINNHGINS